MQQLKNIILIIFSTIIGGIGSYLYHPVMNHYLVVADFARFESLASMFVILGTVTAGFGLYLTRTFAQNIDSDFRLYRGAQRFFFYIGIMIYLSYLPFVWWINSILSIGSPLMVAMIGLVIPLSFASITQGSWLQGRGNFGFLSIYSIITSFGKLLFGWLFVLFGFGIFGAIGGYLFSSFVATLFLVFWIRKSFSGFLISSGTEIFRYFWKGRIELLHFFLLTFLLAILQNMDLILVNRFFSGDIAGKYALVSVIMKFNIFLAASVEIVYYPKLAHQNSQIKDLYNAIGLLSLGSIVGYILLKMIGFYFLIHINIVFQDYEYLIGYFYVFCILFAWLSFFMKIAIAHRLYSVNIIGVLVNIVLFSYIEYQTSLTLVTYLLSFIVALCIILIYSMSLVLWRFFRFSIER